jgi:hypothetical protein
MNDGLGLVTGFTLLKYLLIDMVGRNVKNGMVKFHNNEKMDYVSVDQYLKKEISRRQILIRLTRSLSTNDFLKK